jgi:hypothetical protein
MFRDVTKSDRAATGRHRAPGRNWLGLVSAPGRHSRTLQRRAARQALLLQLELELHRERPTTVLMRRVPAVAG